MVDQVIKIFTMPQEFPCGEGSDCCGPIGQTDDEVAVLKQHLENTLRLPVRSYNVKNGADMKTHRQILTVLRAFGWGVLPIIAMDDEVVTMGNPAPEQAVEAVKNRLRRDIHRDNGGSRADV